ncbi:hypothetical protein RB200_05155 [Streptomyces sp. PmtG]
MPRLSSSVIPPKPVVPPVVGCPLRAPNAAVLNVPDILVSRIHHSLLPPTHPWPWSDLHDGPGFGEAHRWIAELDRIARVARSQQRLCAMKTEGRHTCGVGVGHAADVLRAEIDCLSSSRTSSDIATGVRGRIGRLAWAQAVCSVRAEMTLCPHCPEGPSTLAGACSAAEHAPADCRNASGEALPSGAHDAECVFQRMVRHPSFLAWRPVVDALYSQWLDGCLRHAAAPPALHVGLAALLRGLPGMAMGRDVAASCRHPDFTYPRTRVQRHVHDGDGRSWTLLVATPGEMPTERPRPRPEATLIAAHLAPGTSDALCYVLDGSLAVQDADAFLDAYPGTMCLEELAAALLNCRQRG